MKVRVKVAYEKYSKRRLIVMLQDRDCLIEELQRERRKVDKEGMDKSRGAGLKDDVLKDPDFEFCPWDW